MTPQTTLLPDGRRLHLHHGPIDLIIDAEGPDRQSALQAAKDRFETVLTGLVSELPALRQPLREAVFQDPTSQRMARAIAPFTTSFVTPMAAVAGAVADEVLSAMKHNRRLTKTHVNNGGDIAFHLTAGQTMQIASAAGRITVNAFDTPRGVATSGWQGRSHSCGIADAVTVLAKTAAAADVAATLIANSLDLPGHPSVLRVPANSLDPDTDLGDRLVTQNVLPLSRADKAKALDHGTAFAKRCLDQGLIEAATLTLQGETHVVTAKLKELTHA